ncbi:MAG: sigma 54-interacting transcriptional regulator [Myxococcales bacterium]|nr:sigma 54-interacting transcriptional regulator [Myxococcales bacterium]
MDAPPDLTALTARLAAAADDDARAVAEWALGERHRERGEPEAALRFLSEARRRLAGLERHGDAARVEVALAEVCAARGDGDRALAFLDRALDHAEAEGDDALRAQVQLALGEAAAARGDDATATDLVTAAEAATVALRDRDGHARAAAALARLLARGDQRPAARALIEAARADARAAGRPSTLVVVAMAAAELHDRDDDLPAAVASWREAIAIAADADLRRLEADASLALGLLVGAAAARGATTESAAAYLARAHELYRDGGGLRDLERVRDAFRRFGRRATDRVASIELAPLLDDLRGQRQAVAEAALAVGHAAAPELRAALDARLHALASAGERLATAANAVVVDRENIRGLLELIRALAQITDFAALPDAVARLASQLVGGDRAVVELGDDHRGAVGVVATDDGPWRAALVSARGPTARPTLAAAAAAAAVGRTDGGAPSQPLGQAMVAPLRAGATVVGAIWVDKTPSGGVFTERDLDLLAVFAVQAAAIVDRARAADELRLAARTTATTLAAIGDGVIAVDRAGRLTAINPAAVRQLGLPPGAVDAPAAVALAARAETRALAAVLKDAIARGDELDGRPLTIGATEHLISTRLVTDDRGAVAGLVATLTELRRASSLAYRIVGTTARYTLDDLIGDSPAVRHVRALAEAAASSEASLLLTGESGTGKEVLAQAVHNASPRAAGPFVAVNCAAIPRDLLESELFGYEAGAFTGARKGGRPGKFEIAEGGTLLLDEIGDMPLEMQVKLLRVLQEKTVSRLAGARELPVTCRIIATTNRELDDDVARGLFRRDLFYRLRVIHIVVPPLRERPGDVTALTEHFLRRHATASGKRLARIAPDVAAALVAHSWPGNVRELEHVIESAVALAPPDATIVGALPVPLGQRTTPASTPPPLGAPAPAPGPPATPLPTAASAERDLLIAALDRYHGRIPAVARALGLSRATIYNRMRRLGLDLASFRGPP